MAQKSKHKLITHVEYCVEINTYYKNGVREGHVKLCLKKAKNIKKLKCFICFKYEWCPYLKPALSWCKTLYLLKNNIFILKLSLILLKYIYMYFFFLKINHDIILIECGGKL